MLKNVLTSLKMRGICGEMIIRNDKDRETCIAKINHLTLDDVWEIKADKFKPKRSVAMNALLYAWYSNIAKTTGDGVEHTRGYLKWEFGVPILLARGEVEFDNLINSIVNSMQYEEIINLFGTDRIAISSAMKVPEFLDYLTAIEQYCFKRQIPLARNEDYSYAMTGDKQK